MLLQSASQESHVLPSASIYRQKVGAPVRIDEVFVWTTLAEVAKGIHAEEPVVVTRQGLLGALEDAPQECVDGRWAQVLCWHRVILSVIPAPRHFVLSDRLGADARAPAAAGGRTQGSLPGAAPRGPRPSAGPH